MPTGATRFKVIYGSTPSVIAIRCFCYGVSSSDDLVYSILLNIPINYHPMNLLPAFAPTFNLNIADRLSKPLPTTTHQRIVSLIGAGPTDHPLASATLSTSVASTVDSATVVAPTATTTSVSGSVPSLHPNLTLPTLDTGDSVSISPSRSDFTLEVSQAPYGLIRSAFDSSVVSDSQFNSVIPTFKASSEFASTS